VLNLAYTAFYMLVVLVYVGSMCSAIVGDLRAFVSYVYVEENFYGRNCSAGTI
jgi:hypothetical protein